MLCQKNAKISSLPSRERGLKYQTAVTYNRRFFNNTVGVSAGFYFHYDGVGLGLQQILKVSVNLQKTVYRPKK